MKNTENYFIGVKYFIVARDGDFSRDDYTIHAPKNGVYFVAWVEHIPERVYSSTYDGAQEMITTLIHKTLYPEYYRR